MIETCKSPDCSNLVEVVPPGRSLGKVVVHNYGLCRDCLRKGAKTGWIAAILIVAGVLSLPILFAVI